MHSLISTLARLVKRLSWLSGVIAVVCLAAACLVVCQMVFMRYVLEASTIWQTEFVLYSIVAATLMGSSHVLAVGGHVNVGLLSEYLGGPARRWQQLAASMIGIVFCVLLAISGWRYFYEAFTEGWVTESVWAPPLWIVLLPLPLGLGVLSLQYLVDILALFAGIDTNETES